jgi:hypothetical protein
MAHDQCVVTEHEAVGSEGLPVDAGRHGRIHAFERVGEPGAECPAVVVAVLGEGVPGKIVFHLGGPYFRTRHLAALHMWGTSSGMS